jgi:hypothetical protein
MFGGETTLKLIKKMEFMETGYVGWTWMENTQFFTVVSFGVSCVKEFVFANTDCVNFRIVAGIR